MRYSFYLSAAALGLTLSFPVLATDGISVENGWTRATPPGAVNSATYVTVINAGDESRRIVAAYSNAVKEVQLHTVIDDNGLMKMRQVQEIEVPAGAAVELKSGGLHIMMLGVIEPLREGQSIDLELEFANGERVEFVSPVRKMAAMKDMDHSEMDHSKMKHD